MMKEAKKKTTSTNLAKLAIEGIQDRKGKEITLMDLRKINGAITDYFVLATATSDTQLAALFDSVEEKVRTECGQKPWRSEGKTNREWILLDYGDVVVHLFKKERRSFYNLEGLWGDAKISHIKDEE